MNKQKRKSYAKYVDQLYRCYSKYMLLSKNNLVIIERYMYSLVLIRIVGEILKGNSLTLESFVPYVSYSNFI